ncbi:hypothetical protein ROJ8625_01238 [Roseivivax jejudonensis]|uniref:DUF177 domain-containing protein n=1 Tax=Roseivivax jejudonensis TaxID=1529041 RepID=A0A1X6YRA5_9RHOB|nr:DUF177 domain-containing protein [Roseivivax jejudonensis]SLN29083.1 hypothetical protein ROJ8625_01238 [Roseivivax jejudonensis]
MTASPGPFRTADLSPSRRTAFSVVPDADGRAALAESLGLRGVRKLSFSGEIVPAGAQGFRLEGQLGATLVQDCVVTLAPVTTRIDTVVRREFRPEARMETPEAGSEVEMPEDDTVEALGAEIAPETVMREALMLEIPDYPRSPEAEFAGATAEPEGAAPITDADVKPFAGLAALRDRMNDDTQD